MKIDPAEVKSVKYISVPESFQSVSGKYIADLIMVLFPIASIISSNAHYEISQLIVIGIVPYYHFNSKYTYKINLFK